MSINKMCRIKAKVYLFNLIHRTINNVQTNSIIQLSQRICLLPIKEIYLIILKIFLYLPFKISFQTKELALSHFNNQHNNNSLYKEILFSLSSNYKVTTIINNSNPSKY